MEVQRKLLCHACGSIWVLEKVNSVSDRPTAHCPACGEPMLRPVKSSFEAYTADCFKTYGKELTLMLAQDWARNLTGERTYFSSVVEYILWRVMLDEDTGCVCCSLSQGGA